MYFNQHAKSQIKSCAKMTASSRIAICQRFPKTGPMQCVEAQWINLVVSVYSCMPYKKLIQDRKHYVSPTYCLVHKLL